MEFTESIKMQFTKMHGAGNDYVYIDCFNHETPQDPSTLSIAVADRHKGVGGDGLMLSYSTAHWCNTEGSSRGAWIGNAGAEQRRP